MPSNCGSCEYFVRTNKIGKGLCTKFSRNRKVTINNNLGSCSMFYPKGSHDPAERQKVNSCLECSHFTSYKSSNRGWCDKYSVTVLDYKKGSYCSYPKPIKKREDRYE